MKLRPYQKEAVNAVFKEWKKVNSTLLVSATGCHGRGEKLLMADGTTKAVEYIRTGQHLLGVDGTCRTVLATTSGVAKLYKVIPTTGKPFIVNGEHKLTLIRVTKGGKPAKDKEIIDVSVTEWLTWNTAKKQKYQLFKCPGVDVFPETFNDNAAEHKITPYFLGVLLGENNDGRSNALKIVNPTEEVHKALLREERIYDTFMSIVGSGKDRTYSFSYADNDSFRKDLSCLGLLSQKNKKGRKTFVSLIPQEYLSAPKDVRLELLAGMLDSSGGRLHWNGYEFYTKSKRLSRDFMFLCQSLGFAVDIHASTKWGFDGGKKPYQYRVEISGDCEMIPCRSKIYTAAKKQKKRDLFCTSFVIREHCYGEYFGFTVDKDNRYLLDDFTVTHNCGKTIMFSSVAKRIVKDGGKVLIVAHRGDLLEQAQDKLLKSTGLESELEQASHHASLDANVVVASVQTLSRKERLTQFPKDHFAAVIIDEAHHAVTDSYKNIIEYFSSAKLLGVTATPNRADLRSISDVFETTAFQYDINTAIHDGWLSNIAIQRCNLKIDISDVNCVAGDFQSNELGSALEPYLDQIADQLKEKAAGRKTLVFVPLISIGDKFVEILTEKGLRAANVTGKSKDREEIKQALENGELDVVCNSMLWTEGADIPSVDCIVNLRATRSVGLFRQILGRGLRLSPGKENLLVLDFLWITARKGYDVLSPVDLFIDKEDIPYADDLLESETAYDIDTLGELAAGARVDAAAALAKQLHDAQNRHFGTRAFRELNNSNVIYLYDPDTDNLDTICIDNDPALSFYFGKERWAWSPINYWQVDAITPGQREMLQNIGVNMSCLQFKGQASAIIGTYMKRKDAGLCSFKQAQALKRRGYKDTEMWSAAAASSTMSAIANNQWKIPYGMYPNSYRPNDFTDSVRKYQELYA